MPNEIERWEKLQANIQAVYQTFARYKLTGPIESEMSNAVMVADGIKLGERKAEELKIYQWKAMTTLGTVEDYKHFLPRLLELNCLQRRERVLGGAAAAYEIVERAIDFFTIVHKLHYGEVSGWPGNELDALYELGVARWRWELLLPPDYGHDLQATMMLIAVIGCPLREVLESSLESRDTNELCGLARFVNRCVEFSVKAGGTHLRWTESYLDAPDQFERWLLQPHVEAALEQAFYQLGQGEAAIELSNAVQKIGWLREKQP
jgi:hypothetical protein